MEMLKSIIVDKEMRPVKDAYRVIAYANPSNNTQFVVLQSMDDPLNLEMDEIDRNMSIENSSDLVRIHDAMKNKKKR